MLTRRRSAGSLLLLMATALGALAVFALVHDDAPVQAQDASQALCDHTVTAVPHTDNGSAVDNAVKVSWTKTTDPTLVGEQAMDSALVQWRPKGGNWSAHSWRAADINLGNLWVQRADSVGTGGASGSYVVSELNPIEYEFKVLSLAGPLDKRTPTCRGYASYPSATPTGETLANLPFVPNPERSVRFLPAGHDPISGVPDSYHLYVVEGQAGVYSVRLGGRPNADVTITPYLHRLDDGKLTGLAPVTFRAPRYRVDGSIDPGDWTNGKAVNLDVPSNFFDMTDHDEVIIFHRMESEDPSYVVREPDWVSTLDAVTEDDAAFSRGCEGAGARSCNDALSEPEFTFGGTSYRISAIANGVGSDFLTIELNKSLTPQLVKRLALEVDGVRLHFASGNLRQLSNPDDQVEWHNTGISWSVGDVVELKIVDVGAGFTSRPVFKVVVVPPFATWSTTLTVSEDDGGIALGCSGFQGDNHHCDAGPLDDFDFEYDGFTHEITELFVNQDTGHLHLTFGNELPRSILQSFTLGLGNKLIHLRSDSDTQINESGNHEILFRNLDLSWAVGDEVTVSFTQGSYFQGDDPDGAGGALPTAVTLSLDSTSVGEDAGTVTVTATLDAPAPVDGDGISLRLYAGNGSTAERDADYTMPASIAIAAGERSGTASITVIDDGAAEADETVAVAVFADVGFATLAGSRTLTITDDDAEEQQAEEQSLLERCASHLPQNAVSVAEVAGWRDEYSGDAAHVLRWNRALAALGEDVPAGVEPLTVAESRANERRFTPAKWERVTATLEALDACRAAAQPTEPDPPPNNPPTVANAIGDATIVNESGTQELSLSGVFSDADGDSLTVTAGSSNEDVATASASSDESSLTVSARSRGTATVTVTAADGRGGTVEDSFTVRVKAAPVVASGIGDLSGLAAGDSREVFLSGVFRDADGDRLTVAAASLDDGVVTATVAADGSALTLVAVAEGTATVTVTAEDSDGNLASDAFDVTVARKYAGLIAQMYRWRNDPQWVSHKSHTDRWDRALLAFGEPVADPALTPMTASEAQGYADESWGERWVPVAAALWQIEGGGPPANQPPTVASAIGDATIVHESGTQEVSLDGVFKDADGDALTITAASSDEAVATASVSSDQNSLTVSARSRGAATVTVTAEDGNGGTASDRFTVRVKAAPVVASPISDVSGLEMETAREVSLAGVFRDADNDSLTITAASSDEAIAAVAVAANGSALTLTGVDEGTATVTVTAEDTDGNAVSDEFRVEVVKRFASLIPQMYRWRNDPQWVSHKAHTDRWDRALLAFGEPVADQTLTPMTAAEAQGYADESWGERWVPVAAALREIEGG